MEWTIDLYKPDFWFVVLAGLLVVTPLTNGFLRKLALALLDASFLFVLMGVQAAWVMGGVVLAWVGLRAVSRWKWVVWPAAVVLLLAFVFHKEALLLVSALQKEKALALAHGLEGPNAILAAIGFSYVALRLYEVGRAVLEGRHPPPDLLATVHYLLPFHSLAAGPIQAYDEFVAQPAVPRALDTRDALEAVERIVQGLFKKYVLAATIDRVFLTGFRSSGAYLVFEAQLDYVWLYLDFSAYSDVAVGVGRLLGVATPENFNHPYLARNIIDYWERWHISLSLFIRRNIFIPLQLAFARRFQGNPLWPASVAFMISFVLCGLWHQIGWRWLLWGAIHGVALTLTNVYKQRLQKRLGRKGVQAYMGNRLIRVLATVATYEFIAFTLTIIA